MNIADIEIGQQLVYRSRYKGSEPGPRIRVTEIQKAGTEEAQTSFRDSTGRVHVVSRDRIVGVVVDSMSQVWPVGSQLLGLALHFDMPEDVPA